MFSILLAQAPNWTTIEGAFDNEYKFSGKTIADLFNGGIVNIIFFVAGAAFLLYLISGGVSLMTSTGDPKKVEAAKARITSGLIGFVIIFTSFWIVRVVGFLLGIPDFGGIFGGVFQ